MFIIWALTGIFTKAPAQQVFNELDFYVVAHQDDWQLFMGTNVYNDIIAFDETNPTTNGKKVVLIYTTAGNLHDTDDTRSCNCRDPLDASGKPVPYWRVREQGAKNSVHLAACRMGGWGPGIPYPKNKTVVLNGHPITKYEIKNTVSYFLRIETGGFGQWIFHPDASWVKTADNSTVYADYNDLVNTIYAIYKYEMDSSLKNKNVHFNCQDIDMTVNPNDHYDHYTSGRAASEAANLIGRALDSCLPHTLFIDYNSQNLPANLSAPDGQNEAALTAVYCMALLDYNAWPEWGKIYQDWTCRNYSRTITTCEMPAKQNILIQDSLETLNLRIYPIPANIELNIRFNIPVNSPVSINVFDAGGVTLFQFNGQLPSIIFKINTSNFPAGYYLVQINTGNTTLNKTIFEVMH